MLSSFFDFIGDVFGGSDGKFSFGDLLYTNDKLDPKENKGQMQSTMQEFFESQKDQGI